jgi:hypothetical protein
MFAPWRRSSERASRVTLRASSCGSSDLGSASTHPASKALIRSLSSSFRAIRRRPSPRNSPSRRPAPRTFDLLELLIISSLEDAALELVDPIVEGSEDRKKAVDQAVHDAIQEQRGLVDRRIAPLIAPPDLGEGRAVVAVDGKKEAL